MNSATAKLFDLAVIGAGINGAGIARDASGRGLSVLLIESDDIGAATSSSSSKLIHGGIRYLENFEFRMVAEALAERETIINIATHLTQPMQFVMPHVPGLRPLWMIKFGLLLYDRLGGKRSLPASKTLKLSSDPLGNGIDERIAKGFVYSDCNVDDSRLVLANVTDAVNHGATLLPGWEFTGADEHEDCWSLSVRKESESRDYRARAVVNAAGPWVRQVIDRIPQITTENDVRLVKGSHIIVPALYTGDHAYILQNDDRRVVFVLPYHQHFSVIGTTDVTLDAKSDPRQVQADQQEITYLCEIATKFMRLPVKPDDVVGSWSGVRPLFDDGSDSDSKVTRDYVLERREGRHGAPVLNIYGGKLTTYRHLAEEALESLKSDLPISQRSGWTATEALPGSEFDWHDRSNVIDSVAAGVPNLPPDLVQALFNRHGLRTVELLDGVRSVSDLGQHFGHDLYEHEVWHFITNEWAQTAADILERRTRSHLHLSADERRAFEQWFERLETDRLQPEKVAEARL